MDFMQIGLFVGMAGLGQIVRGMIGIRKAQETKEKIDWGRFLTTVAEGAIIGAIAALAMGQNEWAAFLSGYVGQDTLDSVIGLVAKKKAGQAK